MAGLDLGKQVGPLPLGMWLLVGGGGLGVAYIINKGMAKSAAKASEPSSTQLTESGVGLGGGQLIYNPPTTGTPDATPETNQTWGIKVTNWLVARGIVATTADNAVRKYLTGNVLAAAELAMLNLAIAQFGVPPEPLPPVDQPDPETPPPPSGTAPTGPVGLRVNPATRRNDIVWSHSGQNVTHFWVEAKVRVNGSTIRQRIEAYPYPNTYVWSHHLAGGITTNYTVDYLVVAYNGAVMGGQARTASNFKM